MDIQKEAAMKNESRNWVFDESIQVRFKIHEERRKAMKPQTL